MEIVVFWFNFHWILFLGVQSTISQYWFKSWFGAEQAISRYLSHWWLTLLMFGHVEFNKVLSKMKFRPHSIWTSSLTYIFRCGDESRKDHFPMTLCADKRVGSLPGALLFTWVNLIPPWISNYIHYRVWDEIIYPFPNSTGTVEI